MFSLAFATNAQEHNINMSKLADQAYVHISYQTLEQKPFPSNGLLIETKYSVVLVDTPWDTAQTTQLLAWVKKEIGKPVTHCIVTHSHGDRVTGIPILKAVNSKILAYKKTAELIRPLGYPEPDVILPDDTTFTIDGVAFQTFFPGEGHAPDNIVVWIPSKKILFGGCFVKSVQSFGLGNIADANLKQWPSSIKRVKQKFSSARYIIPGHQGWEDVKSLQHTEKLLTDKEMQEKK
jgi:metallo-beta-lactamase class B